MKIILSGNLRRYAEFEREIEIVAETIDQALDMLVEQFPDLKPVLQDGEGKLRMIHRMYLNGEFLDVDIISHSLKATDELGILTAIVGG